MTNTNDIKYCTHCKNQFIKQFTFSDVCKTCSDLGIMGKFRVSSTAGVEVIVEAKNIDDAFKKIISEELVEELGTFIFGCPASERLEGNENFMVTLPEIVFKSLGYVLDGETYSNPENEEIKVILENFDDPEKFSERDHKYLESIRPFYIAE